MSRAPHPEGPLDPSPSEGAGESPSTYERPGAIVHRTVTYNLMPTRRQRIALDELLESQRLVYNAALEQRIGTWAWQTKSVSLYEQYRELTGAAGEIPSLGRFGVLVHRGTLARLDEGFRHFVVRVRAGRTPGFPRFRGRGRFDSVCWPEASAWRLYRTGDVGSYGRLALRGVGHVKAKLHRDVSGHRPTKLVVRRRPGGRDGRRWEAIVHYRREAVPDVAATGGTGVLARAGLDADTLTGVHGGTENTVELGRPGRARLEADLARKTARLERRRHGSRRHGAAAVELAGVRRRAERIHIAHDHRLSRYLVDTYTTIVIEDPTRTRRARPGTRPVHTGTSRTRLARLTTYKAEEAGRHLILVGATDTTSTCASCAGRIPARKTGTALCDTCGKDIPAGLNACRNLLAHSGAAPPDEQPRPGSGHARVA